MGEGDGGEGLGTGVNPIYGVLPDLTPFPLKKIWQLIIKQWYCERDGDENER
jgi:hypothetical protein